MDENNNLIGRIRHGNQQLFAKAETINKTAFVVYVLSSRVFELFPTKDNFDSSLFLLEMVKEGEK
jgi:hypothetical protein